MLVVGLRCAAFHIGLAQPTSSRLRLYLSLYSTSASLAWHSLGVLAWRREQPFALSFHRSASSVITPALRFSATSCCVRATTTAFASCVRCLRHPATIIPFSAHFSRLCVLRPTVLRQPSAASIHTFCAISANQQHCSIIFDSERATSSLSARPFLSASAFVTIIIIICAVLERCLRSHLAHFTTSRHNTPSSSARAIVI